MAELEFVKKEEEILDFWQKNKIFEKSIENRRKFRPFIFYEGPPTANGKPGIHHVLARSFKDLICRYKTMKGFLVERKAGWDTHGLPVELEVEKELGFKNKIEIEKYGIRQFNAKAKESVWRYKEEWEKLTERMGYWIDTKNPYITFENDYIETVWWLIKQIAQKGLLYKSYKVLPYCPRCSTPLSSHEVSLGYRTVKDPSIYIKFKILNPKSEILNQLKFKIYLLVWTTTPWTLPANVAIAVDPKLDYKLWQIEDEVLISYVKPPQKETKLVGKIKGKELIGEKYEPLYLHSFKEQEDKKFYEVVEGDFISTEEGTGLVHIAPVFGEDDMELSKKAGLAFIKNIDAKGCFNEGLQEVSEVKGRFFKEADPIIFKNLEERNLLYFGDLKGTTHEYPFCWRCQTPLIYYAFEAWYIKMSQVKKELIRNNQKINWVPQHTKEGRFGQWLSEIKDWAISRNRYWGTPLPIWECEKCGYYDVIGSLRELQLKAIVSQKFYYLRHGESQANLGRYISCYPEKNPSHLTEKGKKEIQKIAQILRKENIDLIISSDLTRTKETAEIIADALKIKIISDSRLRETNHGIYNGKPIEEYQKLFENLDQRYIKAAEGGETLTVVRKRVFEALKDATGKYPHQNILIVSHEETLSTVLNKHRPKLGEWGSIPYKAWPLNDNGELDLHRSYIDEIKIKCPKCGNEIKRREEVLDCWFDSGSMPYAQWHFPFKQFDEPQLPVRKMIKQIPFPADYICEAVDQTRGWFYTLLAISTLLDLGSSYKNVISLGLILDEKGEKMSKSKGNVIEPMDIIKKYGIDALRWYLYAVNRPGEEKRFSETDLLNSERRFLNIIWNVLLFYQTYSDQNEKKDSVEQSEAGSKTKIQISNLSLLNQWILADLEETKAKVINFLDHYSIFEATKVLDNFVDDLSRWYLRRSRRIFQKSDNQIEWKTSSMVLRLVLKEFALLLAPFCPFFSEIIWQELKKEQDKDSIHLADYPKEERRYQNKKILMLMQIVRDLATRTLGLRQKENIKVRQPLKGLRIKDYKLRGQRELLEILKEEINVKEIIFNKNLASDIELDTKLTSELIEEGIIREIVRQIQEERKNQSLVPQDKIILNLYVDNQEIKKMIQNRIDYIQKESSIEQFNFKDNNFEGVIINLNENKIVIEVKKISLVFKI
ncbi:MAG: class I tRNA ligase family protein [Candidatus Paceibacterota bacterium]|jgi:isoleucyl-tRNA synthetase